jgi:FAD:protein FMN transferase
MIAGCQCLKASSVEGRRTVDPLTGETVQRNLLAAVVLPSPTDAEAWSTALLVLGEEGLLLFERHNPNGWALLVGNEGKIWQVGKHER